MTTRSYAVLQEPIYARGSGATAWAAQRTLREFPQFAPDRDPLLFTGEMIYPWMFEEITALRPFAEAANLLAERDDWPPPFDPDRLAGNEVPVAAVIYHDDIYVPAELSLRDGRGDRKPSPMGDQRMGTRRHTQLRR